MFAHVIDSYVPSGYMDSGNASMTLYSKRRLSNKDIGEYLADTEVTGFRLRDITEIDDNRVPDGCFTHIVE